MKHAKTVCRGFTLVELMITLTIAAILAFLAIPSLTAYKRNAELTAATNTLLAAINAARGEAMKRGMNTLVVPTNNGTDWNTGWVVFVDKDSARNQTYDAGVDQAILVQGAMPTYVAVSGTGIATGSSPYIKFDASGYAKSKNGGSGNLTLSLTRTDLAGAQLAEQTRRIKIANTGRTRTCKPSSATDSSCSATVND